ncbi:MAG TPA: response regulator [Caldilineaceae bacterium]|nr:response regulator [Caldilineaceae bacterium]
MSKKVLIVDDEANIVISLEFLMQQAGYRVDIARTGHEALEKLTSFQPDLVLLDVMLPGISGFDLCQRIRQTAAWASMKIVMLTAKGRDVEITKGLALGANAYITKPFSTKTLLAEVQKQLRTVETTQERTGEINSRY